MKTGIVLEGGALRTIFSSGACDGLLEAGLLPDYVIGVSAGIAYGVSYVSRQFGRNLEILTKYAEDHKDKFTVKAGFVDGGVIDAAKVAELGKLPNRETLLSMLCSALQGNIRGLAVAINAIAEKNGEGAPAEEAAAE